METDTKQLCLTYLFPCLLPKRLHLSSGKKNPSVKPFVHLVTAEDNPILLPWVKGLFWNTLVALLLRLMQKIMICPASKSLSHRTWLSSLILWPQSLKMTRGAVSPVLISFGRNWTSNPGGQFWNVQPINSHCTACHTLTFRFLPSCPDLWT